MKKATQFISKEVKNFMNTGKGWRQFLERKEAAMAPTSITKNDQILIF